MTLEIGLSDFHKMTLMVMKLFHKKQKPTIITYHSYKRFSNEVFMADVHNRISQVISEKSNICFDLLIAALNEDTHQ